MSRPLRLIAALALLAAAAPAYYHYVHFADGLRHVERFDTAALPDSTVYFYLSTAEQPRLTVNDTITGVISQVRQALAVWDAVPTSTLGVGFGGLVNGAVPGDAPAGEILFAELPPGVLGLGSPTQVADPVNGTAAIRRSQVILSSDLVGSSTRARSSFSELFFTVLVHEIGHALGLQHSLASSAMSTDLTRATTRARPLDDDDILGLSNLYPTQEFLGVDYNYGFSGRVLFADGRPVSLASVGAVSATGQIVTTLTEQDGSYLIRGLTPFAQYRLWAQPLPPATQEGLAPGNVVLNPGADASSPFRASFLGGSSPASATPVRTIYAPENSSLFNITVQPIEAAPISSVTTYSFPEASLPSSFASQTLPATHPAFIPLAETNPFIIATGTGVASNLGRLRVETLDARADVIPASTYSNAFVRLDFPADPFAPAGPVHLYFGLGDDFYILPAAAQRVPQRAPVIYWLVPDFLANDGAWTLAGERLQSGSRVFFDGVEAQVLGFDPAFGEIRLLPPPGPPGHRSVITVYNPDGQSSAFELPHGNVMYDYPAGAEPSFSILSGEVRAGADVVVEIAGHNLAFEPGRVQLGVASSDITVRTVDVVSPDRVRAVITANGAVSGGDYAVTLINGLQHITRSGVLAVDDGLSSAHPRPTLRYGGLVNTAGGGRDVSPYSLASLHGRGLVGQDPSSVSVTFNGVPAQVRQASPERLDLFLPANIPTGVVEVIVHNGESSSEPMLAEISPYAPGLFGLVRDQARSEEVLADGWSVVELIATGLGAPDANPIVRVSIFRFQLTPIEVRQDSEPGLWRVRLALPQGLLTASSIADASLLVAGRRSNAVPLSTAAASTISIVD